MNYDLRFTILVYSLSIYILKVLSIRFILGFLIIPYQKPKNDPISTNPRAFMQQFYQCYLASGNKGLALQQAMTTMQGRADYAHAVYWTGFTLVGSDT